MKETIIIVAIAKNNVIGKDNKLPWYFSEDLKRFKRLTLNKPVIMGKNTFLSLPTKPLPKRTNIVLSSKNEITENVIVKHTLEEAIAFAHTLSDKVYIIGGERVYREALEKNLVTKLEVTKINKEYEGDTYFSKINTNIWTEENIESHPDFSYITYIKKEMKK